MFVYIQMYYMYTLTAIPVVAYEKMEQLLFSYEHHESEKNTCIDHRYRWDCINLHMDAILQINWITCIV